MAVRNCCKLESQKLDHWGCCWNKDRPVCQFCQRENAAKNPGGEGEGAHRGQHPPGGQNRSPPHQSLEVFDGHFEFALWQATKARILFFKLDCPLRLPLLLFIEQEEILPADNQPAIQEDKAVV